MVQLQHHFNSNLQLIPLADVPASFGIYECIRLLPPRYGSDNNTAAACLARWYAVTAASSPIAAVSTRSRSGPRPTGTAPAATRLSTSAGVKSPSGPTINSARSPSLQNGEQLRPQSKHA